MINEIETRLRETPVVALIQANDPAIAVKTAEALVGGGLSLIEVVFRTATALDCLRAISELVPAAMTGAGTVLNVDQANSAIASGARFVVSPGLSAEVVNTAQDLRVPVFPGIATATELQRAWNLGLRTVKFFPAGLSGGPAMLRSLSAVFRDVSFLPTGGVSANNLSDYLSLPCVIACGGSWLTPASEIQQGNYAAITDLAREAVAISQSVRSRSQ